MMGFFPYLILHAQEGGDVTNETTNILVGMGVGVSHNPPPLSVLGQVRVQG